MAVENKALPKSFERLLAEADRPVLVDFWAEWCGPCKMVAPVVQAIAREFKGRLLVVKVNVDEKPHIASWYRIQSIPTLMLFHRGQVLMRQAGAMPHERLRAEISRRLAEISR